MIVPSPKLGEGHPQDPWFPKASVRGFPTQHLWAQSTGTKKASLAPNLEQGSQKQLWWEEDHLPKRKPKVSRGRRVFPLHVPAAAFHLHLPAQQRGEGGEEGGWRSRLAGTPRKSRRMWCATVARSPLASVSESETEKPIRGGRVGRLRGDLRLHIMGASFFDGPPQNKNKTVFLMVSLQNQPKGPPQ